MSAYIKRIRYNISLDYFVFTERNGDIIHYLIEKIGNSYHEWIQPIDIKDSLAENISLEEKNIILNAGTGTGKSTFVIDKLIDDSFVNNVLYFTPRTALSTDIYERINLKPFYDPYFNPVQIKTYQRLEEMIQTGSSEKWRKEIQQSCPLIIIDEYHYFTQDSDFNPNTHLSFDFIKKCQGTKIFLSATGNCMYSDVLSKELNIQEVIWVPPDYSYIKNLYFYQNTAKSHRQTERNDFAREKILELSNKDPNSKIVYFVNSLQKLEELYHDPEIRPISHFFFSKSRANTRNQRDMLDEKPVKKGSNGIQTFEKQILITTTALDVGIDLKDPQIKYLFLDISDANVAIQCLGRKRPVNEQDTCTVYIHDIEKWKFTREKKRLESAFLKALYERKLLEFKSFNPSHRRYKRYLERYANNTELAPYSCCYIDWIDSHGEVKFNRLKFARLKERYKTCKAISKIGYKAFFCQATKLNADAYFRTEHPTLQRNEVLLQRFLQANMGVPLYEEGRNKLAELCCVPDSRRNHYLKQASKIRPFLETEYGITLEDVRKKGYWMLKKLPKRDT